MSESAIAEAKDVRMLLVRGDVLTSSVWWPSEAAGCDMSITQARDLCRASGLRNITKGGLQMHAKH
jgi:hypothetical protein